MHQECGHQYSGQELTLQADADRAAESQCISQLNARFASSSAPTPAYIHSRAARVPSDRCSWQVRVRASSASSRASAIAAMHRDAGRSTNPAESDGVQCRESRVRNGRSTVALKVLLDLTKRLNSLREGAESRKCGSTAVQLAGCLQGSRCSPEQDQLPTQIPSEHRHLDLDRTSRA